jgi:microcystin-dependent protein
MAVLTIPNTFVAGTPALASEVNANFAQIVSWSTGLNQDNMTTFTGNLAFTIANGNAIVIQNNGNDESIKVTQGALLGASKASILITDSQTQTASGAAELKMVLASGATIPAIHVLHGATDTLKLTKSSLNLLGDTTLVYSTRIKVPVQTTAQRNALVSPETASLLYDSTTQQLNEKRSDGWAPVGPPVGSIQMFAGSSAPEGWVLCNGTTLDSVANPKYAALFAVISTTYGGTGAASFKVPDTRGRVPVGAGTGAGLTARSLAGTGGQEDLLGHTHSRGTFYSKVAANTSPAGQVFFTGDYDTVASWTAAKYVSGGGGGTGSSFTEGLKLFGDSGSVNESRTDKNMQPYLVFNYIIKY